MNFKIKLAIILLCISCFGVTHLYAQFHLNLQSIKPLQTSENTVRFGETINIIISYQVDSPRTVEEALNFLKNYYLIIDGVPYKEKRVQAMELVTNRKVENEKNIYEVVYQTKMPAASEESKGITVLSKAWNQHYKPTYYLLELDASIASDRVEDQQVQSRKIKLSFYDVWRPVLFALIFFGLLIWVIYAATKAKFTLIRDDGICTDPVKAPFSLSRLQVLLWTFVIFGAFAYIWSVTDFLPQLTGAHLVLLGIAAGQRLLAQVIDTQKQPAKNVTGMNANAGMNTDGNGCSVGFFTDLISDSSGLSITRLQFLITTSIFLVVFITTAIQKLEMVDFSVEQLGLMGTSAGLYLWNKKLEQQNNPAGNNPVVNPGGGGGNPGGGNPGGGNGGPGNP